MRKTLTTLMLAALAIAPFGAARAQSGYHDPNDGYYDRNGVWHQTSTQSGGYYDSNGVWHPSSTQSDGYYDNNGVWHPSRSDGYYDRNGVWHSSATQSGGYYDNDGVWHPSSTQSGGYYDSNGVWHPYGQPQSTEGGYYDRDGQWHPYATQSGGYYDQYGRWVPSDTRNGRNGYYDRNGQWHANDTTQGYSYRNGRWVPDRYARVTGPDRWTWSDRGRSESLRTATSNLATGTARIEREARRRSTYGDPAAFDALRRLTVSAAELDRLVQARTQSEAIGAAYRDVVNSFAYLQRTAGNIQADAWLQNQLNVLYAQVGRLDHRFFGDRAFGGVNPGRTY
jgi:hypothetical protein